MQEKDRKVILIADDDPSILFLIRTIVEAEGFIGVTAANGKDAYKLLRTDPRICGAIVDIKMPYIEGTELTRFMRQDEQFNQVPVVLMTGESKAQISKRTRDAGAVAVLPKPFSAAQLRSMLRMFSRQ